MWETSLSLGTTCLWHDHLPVSVSVRNHNPPRSSVLIVWYGIYKEPDKRSYIIDAPSLFCFVSVHSTCRVSVPDHVSRATGQTSGC